MEIINFLIERYYLSLPLIVLVILFLISNAKKGGKKISCQHLISLSNNDSALIVDLRDYDTFKLYFIYQRIKGFLYQVI